MNSRSLSPENSASRGQRFLVVIIVAAVCLVAGIIISSNLDLTTKSVAQDPVDPDSFLAYPVVNVGGDLESPFVAVVENAQQAVVHISARTKLEDLPWWHHGPSYSTSAGSGFFFRDDGYILTNNHVIEGSQQINVTTASGYQYEARLVGADPLTDLAVIKIEPEEQITVIPFGDSEAIKVGSWAIAIGNPFPEQGLFRSVTVGVVSAKGRSNLNFGRRETPTYQDYIQTDASINLGNSGGPLLNIRGECIGVNAAISSPTGGSVGIGFAIPINLARTVVPDLIATGKVSRGWLGVILGNLTEQEARRQGLDAMRGVKIDSVFANSPAERAGIKAGDIILSVDNHPVDNISQLSVAVSQLRAGQPYPVEIVRNGKRMTLKTVIGDRDSFLASMDGSTEGDASGNLEVKSWLGMELVTFTEAVAQALAVERIDGVYVRRVARGGPADRSSISMGTVIVQVNNKSVSSIEDIDRISRELPVKERVALIVVEPDGTVARKVIRP
ncbi:MAG: trypsin-like peptidase domain-containing protein [Candidatus Zixiibacteriota bacterium]|nr:MAG: trypsin-like peptidase domain-containing protein [candidate division Zixibacteria bacterium]